jgi:hypothetical protein
MNIFNYKDFTFGRILVKNKEAGTIIAVKNNNTVFIARFFRDGMGSEIKYAFRFKNWK